MGHTKKPHRFAAFFFLGISLLVPLCIHAHVAGTTDLAPENWTA